MSESPTRTSSQAPGHSGQLANDGNPATFWQADANDTNAWLRVDLERIVTVSQTRLMFPTDGNWRYKMEISYDGETNWRLLADQTQAISTSKERKDAVQNSSFRGRFVRIAIIGAPAEKVAAISEFTATGQVAQ